MKKYFLIPIFLLFIINVFGQFFSENMIDENLRKDAFAVVRQSKEIFTQIDRDNGIYKVDFVITILNNKGDDNAIFAIYEDNFFELKSFFGEIFDAKGKSIKKIKKSDLYVTGFSENLATDGKSTFYQPKSPSYPYSVQYSYEMKSKNGIMSYPKFMPIKDFNISVENAEYSLSIPKDINLRFKKLNYNFEEISSNSDKNKTYNFSVKNVKAFVNENYSPAFEDLFPIIYLSPYKFCAQKICGDFSSWENFGLWTLELLKGRNSLPASTVEKVVELTKNTENQREKVKILYNFLQNTTHYVSIQLGIGGWQPIAAADVAKTGFGDCKGLTNYMKTLLETVGIKSYYTIIRFDRYKKTLMHDFPSFQEPNHVILCVPLENDTIWLECTSNRTPFGYIHNGIAGHNALVVRENDAIFTKLPDYPKSAHKEINSVEITLLPDGHAEFEVKSRYTINVFDAYYNKFYGLNAKEENEAIGNLLDIHKPQISNIKKEFDLSSTPAMSLFYSVKCEEYASKTATRMFIPINPIRTSMRKLSGRTRTNNIVFHSTLNETDTIKIRLPKDFYIETKLKPIEISSPYGNFKSEIIEENNTIIYIQNVELFDGNFPATEFEAIKKFYEQIENAQSSKITLRIENTK